jgi:predicted ester cyclase
VHRKNRGTGSLPIAQRWFRGLNEGTIALDLLAPDVTEFVPGSEKGKGQELIRSFVAGMMHVFPGVQHEVYSLVAFEKSVVVEGVISGTHGNLIPASGEHLAGRTVRFRFCTVLEIVQQRIVSYHAYYDQLDLLKQLGSHGPPTTLVTCRPIHSRHPVPEHK